MIPCPKGLAYLPYQVEGIEFARERSSVLFGDEMGLGKTIQAIGWMNCHPELTSALVVCPASLKTNWRRELDKWLISPVVDATITNYDQLHKVDLSRSYDVAVLDEGQYIKNHKSLRSGRCRMIQARYKLLLTGTPILNRPIELWHLMHWLAPELWPLNSYMKFALRYCGAYRGKWGWVMTGATRLEELRGHLSYLMIRRLKKDVLKELPDKRRQIVEMPVSGLSADLRYELEIRKTEAGALEYKYANDVKKLETALQVLWMNMAGLRHEAGLAKAKMAIEFIRDAIESSGKVVVFAQHHDVLDALWAGLREYSPCWIDGRTPISGRQHQVDAFQNNPNCKVFIGQIQAAGTGITLTAASHVIFVEIDWTPGVMSQAEDRCHRIGQKNSVLVQHLVLENSIDAHMAKSLLRKQSIIEKTLN